jgi:hypothetical protein
MNVFLVNKCIHSEVSNPISTPLMKFTVNSSGKGFDNLKNKVYVQESNGCER